MSRHLYESLLGQQDWADLHPLVRRLHEPSPLYHGKGRFSVRRGAGGFVRVLAFLGRLPVPGENVDVELKVSANESVERWLRTFHGRRLVSVQKAGADGLLRERFGILELRLRIRAEAGSLHYRLEACGLRVGPLFIPMPSRIYPIIVSTEGVEDGRLFIRVNVDLPGGSLLVRYEGTLEPID